MKKLWKRFGAIAMMVVLVLTMALPVMAANTPITGTPAETDKATATVSGLKQGDVVTFYQIVKANYANGFSGYEAVKDSAIPLFDANGAAIYPTAEQITDLAKDSTFKENAKTHSATAGENGVVSQDLEAGEWMAIVTSQPNSTNVVYNPMLVSVYYKDGENNLELEPGSVNAGSGYSLSGDDVYAKSSEIDLKKEISGNTDNDVATTAKNGDDLGLGDTVNFTIETTIPSYSEEYTNPEFNIYDIMDDGLTFNKDVKVTVGGVDVTSKTDVVTVKTEGTSNNRDFEIAFKSEYLMEEAVVKAGANARKVVVTYSATINKNATVNFDANENKATVEFTNQPGEGDNKTTIDKKTYQYTFAIDGNINGSSTTVNRKGHELIKVNEKGEPVSEPEWVNDGTEETTIEQGLAGATFQLKQTKDNKGNDLAEDEQTKHTYTATTDSNGYFNGFDHLDAGTYELVETKAPEGYSLNTKTYPVVISATYNEDGTLATYTITIDGEKTSTYEASYEAGEVKTITTVGDPQTYYIKNTKMNALPSTGGMGTYLFTFIGAVLIVLGVIVYRRNKVVR